MSGGRAEIRVLSGTISVTHPDGEVVEPRGKAATLLAFLVSQAGSPVTVNDIIGVVWPTVHDPDLIGHRRVEQLVSEVRSLFRPWGREVIPPRQHDRYRLDTSCERIWVDSIDFDRLARAAHSCLESGDAQEARRCAEKALAFWRRDPVVLADQWRKLKQRRRTVLLDAAQAAIRIGDYHQAANELGSFVEDHPDEEAGWDLLVEAHLANREGVLAAQACEEAARRLERYGGMGPKLTDFCRRLLVPDARPSPQLPPDRATQPPHLTRARAAAQPVPRELPRPIPDFTGRGFELVRPRAQLGVGAGDPGAPASSVVISAIDGMGGIGKSALAIQIAHEVANTGAFPDGQLYVNLQAATPGLTPLHPFDALGRIAAIAWPGTRPIPTDTEEAAARLRSLAADRRLLVLLDNAASAEQVRPLLPASPTCGVLVTSRHVLATLEGARLLHLDVLPPDQALDLLGRIAGSERLAADPEAVAQVVRHCGHLPLAIRIVGGRLAARPYWPVPKLAGLLRDATSRLEELETDELAVRASFDVSLQALEDSPDPLDQAAGGAFGLLSLPDGPDLDLAGAARLLDQSERNAEKLLERLVDAQLLETPRPDRYQFHDLVRLYGRHHAESQHPEPQRLAALTRMLTFYTATAWQTLVQLRPGDWRAANADPRWTGGGLPFPDASTALAWLEAERVNLLAAIPQAAAAVPAIPAGLACQLTQALWGFLHIRGYWDDGVQANQIALELARGTQDPAAQAHAHNDLGSFYFLLGQHVEAIAHCQDALTTFRKVSDRHGEAATLVGLGLVYARLGRYAEAITCQQDSLTVFREMGDLRGEAASLGNLGIGYELLGRYPEAIACQQDGLAIRRELGDRHGEAISLVNLGNIYRLLGRYEEAIDCQENSLTVFRELGDRGGEAGTLSNLGSGYRLLGRYEQAIACQEDSLAIRRELGDRQGEANSLNGLGVVYQHVGRYEEAITSQQGSLTIFRELGAREGEAHSLNNLGNIYQLLGRGDEAIACLQDSLTIHRELGHRHGQVEALRDLGDALNALGHDSEAGAAWHEALAICEALQISEADEIRNRLATLPSDAAEPRAGE